MRDGTRLALTASSASGSQSRTGCGCEAQFPKDWGLPHPYIQTFLL